MPLVGRQHLRPSAPAARRGAPVSRAEGYGARRPSSATGIPAPLRAASPSRGLDEPAGARAAPSASRTVCSASPAVRAIDALVAATVTGTASRTRRSTSLNRSRGRSAARRGGWRGVAGGRDQLQHVAAAGDQRSAPGADQLVDPFGRRAGHRPGHAHHDAVQQARPVRGVERAAAHRRLDDHRADRDGRDEPVAGQEPKLGRGAPRRHLRDHEPAGLGDVGQQVAVPCRVGAVDAAGEHRDRRPAPRKGTAVSRLVDAVGGAGHDGDAFGRDMGGELAGHRGAVRRRRAGPHDRDGAVRQLVEPTAPPDPQAEGRTAALVQPRRVVEVARAGPATRRRPGRRTGCPAGRRARGRLLGRDRAAGTRPRWRARRRRARRARRSWTSSAPSSATSEASRGSPGSASLPSATLASRSASARAHGVARQRAEQQRLDRCAAAARCRARGTSGRSRPRRSATVHASRWTRVPPRRVSRPA